MACHVSISIPMDLTASVWIDIRYSYDRIRNRRVVSLYVFDFILHTDAWKRI